MTVGKPFRGLVVEVALDPVVGHEQGKSRSCIVVQNDIGNRFSSTTIVVPLTDATHIKKPFPVYVLIRKGDGGLKKDSYALCDQIRVPQEKMYRGVFRTLACSGINNQRFVLRQASGLADGCN